MREPDRSAPKVLVLSTDPVVAALLGVLLESVKFEPVYASQRESAKLAVARVRPDAVLIDCEHAEACTEEFYSFLRLQGAATVVFTPGREAYDVRAIAEGQGVAWFAMPIGREELRRRLDAALKR